MCSKLLWVMGCKSSNCTKINIFMDNGSGESAGMELHQATFCWWNSSLVCSGHKLCARKGSVLPMGFLEFPWNIHKNKCMSMCRYPSESSLTECQMLHSPLLSPSTHNSHHSAHQDRVMMPLDPVFMEICCASLGLPCALRRIRKEKLSEFL